MVTVAISNSTDLNRRQYGTRHKRISLNDSAVAIARLSFARLLKVALNLMVEIDALQQQYWSPCWQHHHEHQN
jgi:hypothetical protein